MSKLRLPIDDFLPEIEKILSTSSALVLTAAPGAGKTTRLPPLCHKIFKGQVLVLEPRRMAAMAAATRIAEENNWNVGDEVGWQVRFDSRVGPKTRLIFMTEALLARKMIHDPELKGVDAIILDEFHERSLETDLTYGLLKELREMGRDLKLIIMSATLSAEKIAADLGGVPILQVPGKLFPMEVRYQKLSQRLQTDPTFFENVVDAIKGAQSATKGDLLVFLPGVGEIERTRDRLQGWADGRDVDIVPLHGSLPLDEQRRALQKGSRQRVILSTNIAESSVTVDGVNTVIDTGLAKINKYDVRTGFSRLDLSRISQGAAIQRAGRSARQEPGIAIRLWNKQDELSMPKDDVPDIMRADLSEALLFLAYQGVTDFRAFPWLESPPVPHLNEAENTLRSLGAIDRDHRITERGRKLMRFPVSPRTGILLLTAEELAASEPAAPEIAARIASLLQEKDFLRGDTARSHLGDKFEDDVALRLHLFDRMAPPTIKKAAEQIRKLIHATTREGKGSADEILIRKLLLKAFPDRLCRRRGNSDRGVMSGGRGVKLGPDSIVKDSEFFIAVQGRDDGSETTVGLACGLTKEFLLKELGSQIERRKELFVNEEKGQIFMREGRFFGDLAIEEPNDRPPTPEQIAEKLPELCILQLPEILKRNEGLARWFERYNYLRTQDPQTAGITKENLKTIFTSAAYGEKSIESVSAKDLIFFFEDALTDIAGALKQNVPDKIHVPSGSWIPVQYPEARDPYMEVRLQEVFGWLETPKIFQGRIPLTIHLLAPNFRPVQVTSDLSSFWKSGYHEVRKELRLRYPKHSWPEDPYTAKAEAKGRPRQ